MKNQPLPLQKRPAFLLLLPALLVVGVIPFMRFTQSPAAPPPQENAANPDAEMIRAVESGNKAVVVEFLSTGQDPNIRRSLSGESSDESDPQMRSLGDPLLTIAARSGHTDIVALLLDKGAAINARGRYGATALMVAVREGRVPVVRLLLDRGADPQITDLNREETPLHLAACWGISENGMKRLTEGTSGGGVGGGGYGSPLIAARAALDYQQRQQNWKTITRLLLQGGASPQAKDRWEETPADKATNAQHPELAAIIREWAAKTKNADKRPSTQ